MLDQANIIKWFHDRGLVHGDVTPHNFLVSNNASRSTTPSSSSGPTCARTTVWNACFGRQWQAQTSITDYMFYYPPSCVGKPPNTRKDIYELGVGWIALIIGAMKVRLVRSEWEVEEDKKAPLPKTTDEEEAEECQRLGLKRWQVEERARVRARAPVEREKNWKAALEAADRAAYRTFQVRYGSKIERANYWWTPTAERIMPPPPEGLADLLRSLRDEEVIDEDKNAQLLWELLCDMTQLIFKPELDIKEVVDRLECLLDYDWKTYDEDRYR